jgi:hypothetical protein
VDSDLAVTVAASVEVIVAVAAVVDVVAVAARARYTHAASEETRQNWQLAQEKEWQPVTKLGRLVKAGKIKSMEEMYVHA